LTQALAALIMAIMSDLQPPDRLETERLLLRPLAESDAEAIHANWACDPEVSRYLCWKPHRDMSDTRAYLEYVRERWASGAAFDYGIERREDGELIGAIAIRPAGHQAELGYNLGRAFWGRGYATEAVRCLADWALAQPPIYRVYALHDVDNPASGRVLEKAGFIREGLLRRRGRHPNVSPEPRDAVQYAKTR
jgi:RimJ/RimL family protein N-acetyltransferase